MTRKRFDKLQLLLLGALALGAAATPSAAQAAFNCGTGWTLYTGGGGVRCVKFIAASGTDVARYAWYGEGRNQWGNYRHIGVAALSSGNTFRGSLADLNGNGEAFKSFYDNNVVVTRSSAVSYPTNLTVAPFNETWTNTSAASFSNYSSPFSGPIVECGAHFQSHGSSSKLRQFKVYNNADSATFSHVGVRCVLGLTAGAHDVWYGSGEIRSRSSQGTRPTPTAWSGQTNYSNLGARRGTSYGQWDIRQHGAYDGQREIGSISSTTASLANTGNGRIVSGGGLTAELWLPSRRRHSFRLRPYRTSDDFCNAAYTTQMSSADVTTQVNWANNFYGGSNVEFLYNTSVPSGTGGVLTTECNTALNNAITDDVKSGPRAQGDYIAERYPSDITVFFLHGPTANVQQGGGSSWSDQKFVFSRPFMSGPCGPALDVVHMAHEVGHYLGLSHTHAGAYKTHAAAEKAYNDSGCNGAIFDGDGIDTNWDPFNDDQACDAAQPAVYLRCTKTGRNDAFYPEKDNVMSYWQSPGWPSDKTLTTAQAARIESLVGSSSLRKRLE
jgi:hypothetical protein